MQRKNTQNDPDLHRKPPFFPLATIRVCHPISEHMLSHRQLPYPLLHRNTLAQLKDAYTKLFEDYNELKEEKKKREVEFSSKPNAISKSINN